MGEGTTWTKQDNRFLVTNLRKNHGESMRHALLHKFYYGLIEENFPFEDELDPFEVWEENLHLSPGPNDDEGEEGSPSANEQRDVVFEVLLFFDNQKNKNLPLVEREIIGGSVCEFFLESKCGLISYFVVSTKERGRGLSKEIIRSSVETLHRIGRELYPQETLFPVFAETNDPAKIAAETDSLSPNIRLGVLHNLGFGLLDCDYVQPPLAKDLKPCKDLLLTVYLEDKLPHYIDRGSKRYFLPARVVLNWLKEFWLVCCDTLSQHELDQVEDYAQGMRKLTQREKVDVLDLRLKRRLAGNNIHPRL